MLNLLGEVNSDSESFQSLEVLKEFFTSFTLNVQLIYCYKEIMADLKNNCVKKGKKPPLFLMKRLSRQ